MAKLTPREATDKHARRLKGATEDIRKGVERVTEAPGVKAAAKVNKMRANLLKSLDDGTWERRVAGVSLGEWKQKMLNKGVGRIASGVDEAAGKIENFYTQLFPFQEQIQNELESMPDLTLEDNITRMVHSVRRMSEFKKE